MLNASVLISVKSYDKLQMARPRRARSPGGRCARARISRERQAGTVAPRACAFVFCVASSAPEVHASGKLAPVPIGL